MKILTATLAAASLLALAACDSAAEAPAEEATPTEEAAPLSASATLVDTAGNEVGTVTATDNGGTLAISLSVNGLPEGEHGAHIHTTGDCSAADFTSAGGHWNPGETNHGVNSEAPNPHAGDLPNLVIDAEGNGTLEAVSSGSMAGLLDDDGAAFIVHADPDDYQSQPTGNAGARLACGVFAMN